MLRRAGLPMVRMVASRFRRRLSHIFTLLGRAVPLCARAVIDMARGVHPDLARTASRSDGHTR